MLTRLAQLYIALLSLLSVLVMYSTSAGLTAADWPYLVGFAISGTALSFFNYKTQRGQVFTFGSALHIAAFMLLGLPFGVWSAALGVAGQQVLEGKAVDKVAFNVAQTILTVFVAGSTYTIVAGQVSPDLLPVAGLAAALAYLLTNGLLFSFLLASLSGRSVLRTYRSIHRPDIVAFYLISLLSGVLGAHLWQTGGWAWVAVLVAALAFLRGVTNQYFTTYTQAAERSEQLDAVLQSAGSAIVTVDAEGKVQLVNEAFLRSFGVTREQVLGQPFTQLVDAEQVQQVSNGEQQLLRVTTEAGQIRSFAWHQSKVPATDGVISVFTDISDRVATEQHLRRAHEALMRSLSAAIDARDTYTSGHSYRVSEYTTAIARVIELDQAELEAVRYSALLHDIGKVGVDDRVLRKKGPLDEEEWAQMKEHPVIGYELLRKAGVFDHLLPGVRWHHERLDGKGYPDGLVGEAIPLQARIIAVADAFDAMTTDRPYRLALDRQEAVERLRAGAGTQFDPVLVEALIDALNAGLVELGAEPQVPPYNPLALEALEA